MRNAYLGNMVKGWFVGNFNPTALATEACEVAVKRSKAGHREAAHCHKIGTEITLVLSGRVRMIGREWGEGDIVIIEPGETSEFEALTDTTLVVVKVPGAPDDKYMADGRI